MNVAWIAPSLLASFFQVGRAAFQKEMKKNYHAFTVAWCRYFFGLPLIFVYLLILWGFSQLSIESVNTAFLKWSIVSAVGQSAATALQIELLGRRSLATGIVLVKTEAIFALLIGYLFIGDVVSRFGFVSVLLGSLGIICVVSSKSMSQNSESENRSHLKQSMETALLGLSSALLFAITAVAARAATKSIVGVHLVGAVGMTLATTVVIQAVLLGVYLAFRKPVELSRTLQTPKVPLAIGVSGVLGSLCWFSAFSLANVAYVKTVAQVEVVASIIIGRKFFSDTHSKREIVGIALIVISAITIAFA